MIASEITDGFGPYLQAGERFVWTGRPVQGVRFGARDFFLIPFSLLWGGFAIVWESIAFVGAITASASAQGAGVGVAIFPLFGIPFVLAGLYLIVGRFFADAWVRSRITYALTDRRALVLRRMFGDRLSAVSLTHCPGLSLNLRGARGDVDFEPSRTRFFRGGNAWMPSLDGATRFIGIEDAADVFRMAQSASGRD
jgi:hypothetical protein